MTEMDAGFEKLTHRELGQSHVKSSFIRLASAGCGPNQVPDTGTTIVDDPTPPEPRVRCKWRACNRFALGPQAKRRSKTGPGYAMSSEPAVAPLAEGRRNEG